MDKAISSRMGAAGASDDFPVPGWGMSAGLDAGAVLLVLLEDPAGMIALFWPTWAGKTMPQTARARTMRRRGVAHRSRPGFLSKRFGLISGKKYCYFKELKIGSKDGDCLRPKRCSTPYGAGRPQKGSNGSHSPPVGDAAARLAVKQEPLRIHMHIPMNFFAPGCYP